MSLDKDIKGSIEVGKLADIVILSGDPTKTNAESIKDIQVEKTILGGEIVYSR
jgi:predicted amidohydrolase YtcJ